MPGSVKAEAVVLRSMRYGEADRILHLYTSHRGKIGAIAKGVRKGKSRFGGRLEPFFHTRLILHEGRSDLMTVTGAETVQGYPRLRENGAALDSAARACDAVGRLFDTGDAHPGVFHLLCNELALLEAWAADGGSSAAHANQLQFRLKLLLAAGFAPQLSSCVTCGEGDHLAAFSGAAGGVVCTACQGAGFPLDEEAHGFLTGALGAPLSAPPEAGDRALRQAERAINETAEYHAHVRLREARPRG